MDVSQIDEKITKLQSQIALLTVEVFELQRVRDRMVSESPKDTRQLLND